MWQTIPNITQSVPECVCSNAGSNVSHFNGGGGLQNSVRAPQLLKRKESGIEPGGLSAYQPHAFLLGHTGLH